MPTVVKCKPRDKLGRFKPSEVEVRPTREWGYFCGLIIGDGYVYKNRRNYLIAIRSTKKELIEIFCDSAEKIGLKPHQEKPRLHKSTFPNGVERETLTRDVRAARGLGRACKTKEEVDRHIEILRGYKGFES
jgi:hypothetical protein